MKKAEFSEKTRPRGKALLGGETPLPGGLANREIHSLEFSPSEAKTSALDTIFTIVKWLFLVLPGIAAIPLAMVGLALMLFYRDFEGLGLLGLVAVGTFMIMLGFGKMRDLKYLKTVLTIIGFSLLTAIFYDVLAVFIKGDFFSLYVKLTFPLVVATGYLSRRSVDAEEKLEK